MNWLNALYPVSLHGRFWTVYTKMNKIIVDILIVYVKSFIFNFIFVFSK